MLKETKKYLKSLALEIRELKSQRKLPKRGDQSLWSIETKIYKLKYEYRHFHISYCEIRGRKRDQIEIPASNNLPNQKYIDQIKEKILKEYHDQEAIRAVA
jgi:hypothetical protein